MGLDGGVNLKTENLRDCPEINFFFEYFKNRKIGGKFINASLSFLLFLLGDHIFPTPSTKNF